MIQRNPVEDRSDTTHVPILTASPVSFTETVRFSDYVDGGLCVNCHTSTDHYAGAITDDHPSDDYGSTEVCSSCHGGHGGFGPAVSADNKVYVDKDANGGLDNGMSWNNAFVHLRDALDYAWDSGGGVTEIRVAEGIYRPDTNSAEPNGSGDRSASFVLLDEVTFKGGYAGYGEANPDLRRHDVFRSILSGDLGGNDVQGLDPCDLLNHPSRADNSYHVVWANEVNGATLDGFTIQGGNANGVSADSNGGGLYSVDSNITVTKCYWWRCSASSDGGAVWSGWSEPLSMTHCSGSGNSAGEGAALYNFAGLCRVSNCTFSGNDANERGGGLATGDSNTTLHNNTWYGNSAGVWGGAQYNWGSGTVTNLNSIFWNNTDASGYSIVVDGPDTIFQYSDLQGGQGKVFVNWGTSTWGNGNIDADPQFVDPDGSDGAVGTVDDDFHLRSQFGTWNSNEGSWDTYGVQSPAIDAGEPYGDIGDEPFPNGGRVNAGAYGSTSEASLSGHILPPCGTHIAGDIDGDCKVNFTDFAFIADNWLADNTY
jgi:hypothetical protein